MRSSAQNHAESAQPLRGVLVVDLSRHLPGPFAARMLANLGARVVKIEEPELGDPVRSAPPFRSGRSLLAESLLCGLESVALDLKKEGGREVLGALLAEADVLLETFRPGTMARLDLAPEELRKERPRLVICSISGWGSSGPAVARSGHDLTYQAAAGALAATGQMPNLPAADLQGSWSAVAAICAALLARERSGVGTWIDASLFDASVVGNLTNFSTRTSTAVPPPSPSEHEQPHGGTAPADDLGAGSSHAGPLTGALPCYRLYRTADDQTFALAALEEKFWRSFCDAVGRSDLLKSQYRQQPEDHRAVADLMSSRTAAEWSKLFEERDLPGQSVLTPDQALGGEQAKERGLAEVARGGVPFPATIGGERPKVEGEFPRLGEHTREVVGEFCPEKLRSSRRSRIAAGIGPRLSLRRAVQGWVGALRV